MTDIVLRNEALNEGELRYKHLLDKEFKLGTTDCYTIPQMMLLDNLNIQLTSYARPKDWWCDTQVDIYVDNYEKEGFKLLHDPLPSDLRPFDLALIAIPDPRQREFVRTNHCAMFLNKNWIIHHRMGDISRIEPYRGSMRMMTTHIIRHKDVPDLKDTQVVTADLRQYILPHKLAELERNTNDSE